MLAAVRGQRRFAPSGAIAYPTSVSPRGPLDVQDDEEASGVGRG